MEEKTHFKKAFNSPYLGSQDLPDYKDLNLTIDKVVCQTSKGLKENSLFNIVHFKEEGFKPMLLNATNSRVLKNLAKSPYIEDWAGLSIIIYVQTGVKAFGGIHDALRIRPKLGAGAKKPTLDTNSKNWEKISEKVKSGVTVEKIREHYNITDELFKKLG